MNDCKLLYLICGAPGSGKSTLADGIKAIDAADIGEVCEADGFWYILGHGKYAFNPKLLWKAHKWCQDQAKKAMGWGKNVIVANTNINPSQRAPYFDLARAFGYKVVFIHLTTQFQNVHSVPEDVVCRMRESFADPTDSERSLFANPDTDIPEEVVSEFGHLVYRD